MDNQEERWVDIPGFEGFYQVSDHGNVRSLDRTIVTKAGHRCTYKGSMKKAIVSEGYYRVTLSKNSDSKTYKVHRLVAENFVPGMKDGLQVNHMDGNRLNNHYSNLEWITHVENLRHARMIGISEPGKPVIQCKDGVELKYFESITEASREVKCKPQSVKKACVRGGRCRGYEWKFAN